MIKGVRGHFIVLILAASLWIASSLNAKYRQKRQLRNAIYLQPLHNGRYLRPIPIQIPPYFKEGSESASRSSASVGRSVQSPWIPLQSSTSEEINNKNVYVPPIRPPAIIVTRKPPKTTFDIPLTKSIQVSQARPNIQTTGYIRKNLVKVYATRTTTEHPRLKMLGSLAESTVQTLLNFTPVDEGWRPKSVTTPQPTAIPNFNFGKNLGSKVDKHLNYTGVRFGKVNSVMKTMPQNGAAVKVLKNETNFLMKFTPEDIKFTSVEVKTEKIDTPFHVDSPEVKHLNGDFEVHRAFFDGFSDPRKTVADLRNEGNLPYQGHRTSMEKVPTVRKGASNVESKEYSKDRRTIFDIFPNAKKSNADLKKEIQFQGQGSFVNVPLRVGNINSSPLINKNSNADLNKEIQFHGQGSYVNVPLRVGNINYGPLINQSSDQNGKTFVNQGPDNTKVNVDTTTKIYNNDHRNFFIEPSNVYGVSTDQQVKSNLPYQGHATGIHKPSISTNSEFSNKNKVNLPYRAPQTFLDNPSSKPMIANREKVNTKHTNDKRIIYNVPFKSSPQNIPINHGTINPFEMDNDSVPPTPAHSSNTKYDSISSIYVTNRTVVKDIRTVTDVPLTTEIQYHQNNSPNVPNVEEVKKNNGNRDTFVQKPKQLNVHKSSPKSHSVVSISHEDISSIYRNKENGFVAGDQLTSKPALGEAPKLKEVELKNPPLYLQFGDEDFLKPIIPLTFEKENTADKSLSAFTFSDRGKPEEGNKKNSDPSKDTENLNLPKISNPISSQMTASKVEYYENSKLKDKEHSKEQVDNVYFQPIFPETSLKKPQDNSPERFQNYNNEQTSVQSSDATKEDTSSKPGFATAAKDNSKPVTYDTSREKYKSTLQKINKDVIITKNTNFSPEDTKRNGVRGVSRGQSNDFPRIITPPPVITMNYDPMESDNDVNKRGNQNRPNRTENYVIQRKPALLPESSGRPRKPKITISTGMLAGILIAALVFLGFLTGSMVYAFHQWKFGRSRSERQKKKKKARSPGFPPEYLDENFAGNTYIHNNIFLPTPQNLEERNSTDPDNSSMIAEEPAHEQPSTSSRVRRHRANRELRED